MSEREIGLNLATKCFSQNYSATDRVIKIKYHIQTIFQGEKAYSCAQCGTRFTYRNGLIKHTKLNRCPKKIVTADGETIIKKRSRTSSTKLKQNVARTELSPTHLSGSPIPPMHDPDPRKIGLVNLGAVRRPSSSGLVEEFPANTEPQFFLPPMEGGGVMTFGMTTLTSPTTTSTPTTKVETMHQAVVDGVLPDSTVTELSLATGKNWTRAVVVV